MQKCQFPVLIADVGGTNTRFGMLQDAQSKMQIFAPLSTCDFTSVQGAAQYCLAHENAPKPAQLVIGAAGSIAQKENRGECHLSNGKWVIKPAEIVADLNLAAFEIMNDFCAQALGVLAIDTARMLEIRTTNSAKHLQPDPSGPRLVVGPGTGFGIAFIVRASDKWVILPSEGATADLGLATGLNWQREQEIEQKLMKRDGRQTIDNLLSGSGLENIHRAICNLDKSSSTSVKTAQQISSSTDQNAKEAVSLFVSILGRVTGNLALTIMATGGVFVTGGIAHKMRDQIETGNFRTEFDHKSPHNNLANEMSTYLVNQEFAALEGLAHYVRNPSQINLNRAAVKISA